MRLLDNQVGVLGEVLQHDDGIGLGGVVDHNTALCSVLGDEVLVVGRNIKGERTNV